MTFAESNLSWRNSFVFKSSPETLLSLATSKVAFLCWRCRLEHFIYAKGKGLPLSDIVLFPKLKFSCSDIFQAPECVERLIDRRIEFIGKELEKWLVNDGYRLCKDDYRRFSKFMDRIVLEPGGKISYDRTARKLLSSGDLDSAEKYNLACLYCFKKLIVRLRPSAKIINFRDRLFESNTSMRRMMYYWNCIIKKELPNLILGNAGHSTELRMLRNYRLDKRSQIEYFWKKLDNRVRNSQLIYIFNKQTDVKVLLPKLKRVEVENVLRIIPSEIMYNLAENIGSQQHVSVAWEQIKDSVTEDQLLKIIRDLICLMCRLPSESDAEHVPYFMYEVWISAPERLRRTILELHVKNIFDQLASHLLPESDLRWYGSDMRFFVDLFSSTTSVWRTQLWRKHFPKLMLIAKVSDLRIFMELCFDTEDRIVKFKERSMIDFEILGKHFDSFIAAGLCDELIDYLKFCSSDEERVRSMMRQIIDSNVGKIQWLELRSISQFNNFINQAFLSTNSSNQFKEQIIKKTFDKFGKILNEGIHLRKLRNIIECLMSSDPHRLFALKRRFYRRSLKILSTGSFLNFNAPKWEEFLKWCGPNEQNIVKFKGCLPIDDVFENFLGRVIKKKLKRSLCADYVKTELYLLNEFLLWYFESDVEVKKFKLNKINKYEESCVIRKGLKIGKKRVISYVFQWLFDFNSKNYNRFCDRVPSLELVRISPERSVLYKYLMLFVFVDCPSLIITVILYVKFVRDWFDLLF